jgi:phage-related protein
MDELRRKGTDCQFPVTKPLGNGLFELRAKTNTIRARVIFFFRPGQEIVFIKAFKHSGKGRDQGEYQEAIKIKKYIDSIKGKINVFSYIN